MPILDYERSSDASWLHSALSAMQPDEPLPRPLALPRFFTTILNGGLLRHVGGMGGGDGPEL